MIRSLGGHEPVVGKDVFVAQNATVVGQVTLGEQASIWYGTVVRGDVGTIKVGARSNVQDNSVIHITGGFFDTAIGDDVTIGHRAIIHGCTIENNVLIGMGAIIMDGAHIEERVLVGAGALVPPGMRVPSGHLVVGSPAKVVRPLKEKELQLIEYSASHYVEVAGVHRAENL